MDSDPSLTDSRLRALERRVFGPLHFTIFPTPPTDGELLDWLTESGFSLVNGFNYHPAGRWQVGEIERGFGGSDVTPPGDDTLIEHGAGNSPRAAIENAMFNYAKQSKDAV